MKTKTTAKQPFVKKTFAVPADLDSAMARKLEELRAKEDPDMNESRYLRRLIRADLAAA